MNRKPSPVRHIRLTSAQQAHLAIRYRTGATVYELAEEFGIKRQTVSKQLKQQGVVMRLQSPTDHDVDRMLALYRSGLSLVDVGAKVGFSGRTVELRLKARGVVLRDPHGRPPP